MTIEKRLERLEAILDARGLDWDHPRVTDEPPKEPPKKWRILEPGEVVCSGDRVNAKTNPPSDPPNGSGWRLVYSSVGTSVCKDDHCLYARPVADEPVKEAEHPAEPMPSMESYRPVNNSDIGKTVEVQNSPADPWRECTLLAIDWDRPYGFLCRHSDPVVVRRWWCFSRIKIDEPAKEAEPEHPAGPMPDPGEGYRILAKNPPEDLQPGDEYRCHFHREKQWVESTRAREGYLNQLNRLWYRRKIEASKPPEPEYREPVLPGDAGKVCEFSDDGNDWTEGKLRGYTGCFWQSVFGELVGFGELLDVKWWTHARIKKDA
jgi:hypothetical protein